MGKGWDYVVPEMSYWKEALRVAKPGAFLISMGGTRTFHRLTCAIEDAGWEIRDCISWLYGSGFPKSHNHFGIEGYGTALKPAWEPCIVAMKPLDGTFKQNAEKWGQAGINIDGCRIVAMDHPGIHFSGSSSSGSFNWNAGEKKASGDEYYVPKGRWPSNVIFDEEAGALLDEQSGHLKSGTLSPNHKFKNNHPGWGMDSVTGKDYPGTSGGASRFFYCAKASSRERNEGLEGLPDIECQTGCSGAMPIDDEGKERDRFKKIAKNNHPTVKPLKLMEYLIKLVMPPKEGLLLDPFAGSGSTILAAKRLGFDAIGIEKQPEYAEIARARIAV
jgi:site-specific DNA-methyltransferase (adenine-specific)